MASNIPAALKSADVGRFAVRAAQLEKAKPIIAYWCNFYIVNQIIEKGLHNADEEVKIYTTALMEKLEQFQNGNRDNDAITDSMAASAYVEEFGLEVFGRAEAALRADKVTKQTADTLQAAATFLELCQVWNPLEAEVAAKVKFAKYHAVRIVKAIKAGEDPNATNPKIEEEAPPAEDDLSSQLQTELDASSSQAPMQPSVEDDLSEAQPAQPSDIPPALPQPPTSFTELPSAPQGPASATSRTADVAPDQDPPLNLPSAPNTFASSTSSPNLPDTPSSIGQHQPKPSNEFQSFPPPSTTLPTVPGPRPQDVDSYYNAPSAPAPPPFVPPAAPAPARVPSYQPSPIATPPVAVPSASTQPNHNLDDQSISLAQKHARWAVSALTFDDVNTAIKELRNSLKYLGAE